MIVNPNISLPAGNLHDILTTDNILINEPAFEPVTVLLS